MYKPEQFLINEIAPELVRRGHSVTVLTGLPNYPEGFVLKEYRFFKNRNEVTEGVKIKRCFEIGRRNSKVFLILNYLSYAISASIKILFIRERFDVVFSYQLSPVTMVYPAIIYKLIKHVKILLYCLDIWPESAQAHVNSDEGKLYKIISKLSKSIYNKCDKIAVTSEPFIEYLEGINGVSRGKMCYIPQHADPKLLDFDLVAEDNGVADFMFAGNIGYGQNLETIIKAVGQLREKDGFIVHIVGDGSRTLFLKELARQEGVEDKIIFHGRFSNSEMLKFYKMADALLITLRGNNFVGMTMPGKLQTYMTTGKPIFGAINGAANKIITEADCGACVNSGDYQGLAVLLRDYIDNPQKYDKCGRNAKEYFKKNFIKEIYINSLENELLKLV